MTLFVYRAYVDITTQQGIYFNVDAHEKKEYGEDSKSAVSSPGTKKTTWIISFLGSFQRTLPINNFIVGLQLQKWVDTLWLFKSITFQYWKLPEWDCVHRIDWWLTALHPSLVKYVNQVSHQRMISLTLQLNLSMTKCSIATPFKTILE